MMSPSLGVIVRVLSGLLLSSYLSISGYRKQRLSKDGSAAAFLVGLVTFGCSYVFGITLIVFYFTSSKLTKYKEKAKQAIEDDYKIGGQRNALQVLVNSINAFFLAAAIAVLQGDGKELTCVNGVNWISLLAVAFLGHFASCTGDTWSSEIGPVFSQTPILITTLKRVPAGTNGGVSLPGFIGAAAGGLCIGVTFSSLIAALAFLQDQPCPTSPWSLIPLGVFGGVFGSLFDSILGATLQASDLNLETKKITHKKTNVKRISGIDLLSNDAVNYLANTATAIVTPLVYWWFLQ